MTTPPTGRYRSPSFRLVDAIAGELGELLAAVWLQGTLRTSVTVSTYELTKARGYGVEIFQDADGNRMLIAVNHPWTEPTEPEDTPDDRPIEHQL